MTRWRTVGLVVGIASVMYVIPLEWGVRPGFAWMIRVTVMVGACLWALGAMSHLKKWGTTREQATTLAVFRIAMGACLVWTVATVIQADLVPILWVSEEEGGYRALGASFWLVRLLGGPTVQTMMGLAWIALGSGVCLMMGIGGRWTPFVALQSFMAVSDINAHAGGSYDELLSNALWILVLAPATETLSLDCRIQSGRWRSNRLIFAWPRYLIMFQIVLVYWTTGVQKVSAYWVPGGDFSALYFILQQPSWHRFDMTWLAWVFPMTQVATAVTWFWEVLSPIWLLAMWYRYTAERPGTVRMWFNRLDVRLWYAVMGLIFHIIIFSLMDVGPFSPISVGFYICFWHPTELRGFGEQIRRRWLRRTTPRTVPSPAIRE